MADFTFPPPASSGDVPQKAARAAGFFVFFLTILLYSACIWWLNKVLFEEGILDWRFEWTDITSVVGAFMLARIWDRAFMRPS